MNAKLHATVPAPPVQWEERSHDSMVSMIAERQSRGKGNVKLESGGEVPAEGSFETR